VLSAGLFDARKKKNPATKTLVLNRVRQPQPVIHGHSFDLGCGAMGGVAGN